MFSATLLAQAPASKPTLSAKPASPAATPQAGSPSAQKSAAKPNPVKGWKTYCSKEGGYCLAYPPTWDALGEIFEGTGVVIAPPQPNKDQAAWDQVTASVTDLPEPQPGKERPSFNDILNVAINDIPGANVQTLRRSELKLRELPAQLVTVRYQDPQTNATWIEEIAFLDGDDVIFSVSLRAAPEDVEKLEPTFRLMVASWRLSDAGR